MELLEIYSSKSANYIIVIKKFIIMFHSNNEILNEQLQFENDILLVTVPVIYKNMYIDKLFMVIKISRIDIL